MRHDRNARRPLAAALGAALLGLGCGDARPLLATPASDRTCSACHGSAASPAPPASLSGSSSTADLGVGAHQLHLRDTAVRRAVACSECHVVPAAVDSPGHVDAAPAEVTFGPLATRGGALAPAWSRAAAACSGVYCHGATLGGGSQKKPTWTFAAEPDPARPEVCGTCHGAPPPPPHPAALSCRGCHPETVREGRTIDVGGGRHIDGLLQVEISGACDACHGFPPASGAHLAHFGLTGLAATGRTGDLAVLEDRFPADTPTTAPAVYAFGCGICHPIDPARHLDGQVEVELHDPAAPAGSLKARSPAAAAYDPASGTCSSVYCHSSGQEAPSWTRPRGGAPVASPGWTSGQHLGCGGCHDNPPAYPSGGAGAPDANTHLVLADDGWELGHYAGLPGPWHSSKHGGSPGWPTPQDGSAITCQTCHADTVDPASTGASGFYWLDTTGDYRLDFPGADPARLTHPAWLGSQCRTCHGAPGGPPAGAGRVLPLRHVNGKRDVVFDARTSLPAYGGLPPPPDTPTRPTWVTNGAPGVFPPDSGRDGATFSLHLAGASYDAATKTCSNVACHLAQTAVPWGVSPAGGATCNACHGF